MVGRASRQDAGGERPLGAGARLRRAACAASYTLAALLLSAGAVVAWLDLPLTPDGSGAQHWLKLTALALLLTLGIAALGLGLSIAPSRRWRRSAGAVVLGSIGLFSLAGSAATLTLASPSGRSLLVRAAAGPVKATTRVSRAEAKTLVRQALPELRELYATFGDTVRGAATLVGLSALGCGLLVRYRPRRSS